MMYQSLNWKRVVPSIALGCLLTATPVWAAPGDPLGGDDTGCAPSTSLGLTCGKKVSLALVKLRRAVLKCHLKQAGLAFKTGMGTVGGSNAEENCEVGNPTLSAKAKFDARMTGLGNNGCDATVIANANARRDIILGDQNTAGSMDAMNSSFFCDTTSGNQIDPGGDDGGYIPATPENYKCSVLVAKWWAKLNHGAAKCHSKLAAAVFNDNVFDEEADCENVYHTKYDLKINSYIASGICPPCLADPPGAIGIGNDEVAASDANLQEVFICPGP